MDANTIAALTALFIKLATNTPATVADVQKAVAEVHAAKGLPDEVVAAANGAAKCLADLVA